MYRLRPTPRPCLLGNLNAVPRKLLLDLEAEALASDPDRPPLSTWRLFEAGRVHGQDVFLAERPGTGPREPTLVWTGTRWVSSEDELSPGERELMDRLAARCPGGLGGWS